MSDCSLDTWCHLLYTMSAGCIVLSKQQEVRSPMSSAFAHA